MIICNCILHIELPYVQSLKGRRSVTNSMKEKLKAFNLSVLDLSGEYAKEADIAFVFLSPNSLRSAQYREKIEKMLERHFGNNFVKIHLALAPKIPSYVCSDLLASRFDRS